MNKLEGKVKQHVDKVEKDKKELEYVERTGRFFSGEWAPISWLLSQEQQITEEITILEQEKQ